MPRLSIVQGPDTGRSFDISGTRLTIGRGSGNTIVLNDSRVSRKHCEIDNTKEGLLLHDLQSGNGTLVNGKPVHDVQLLHGDRITVGDTVLQLEVELGSRTYQENPTRVVVRPSDASEFIRSIPAEAGSQMLTRPDLAETDWLRIRLANLAVMYEATNVIRDILDVDVLLERIVELVLRTTDADHGCAMIYDAESNELMPKAMRSRRRSAVQEFVVSRTVVDHVYKEKVGVLVADASRDERFRQGESIARHQIREVLCVPMRGRHETVGVLFLDILSSGAQPLPHQTGKFTEDHLRLAVAVAHQAALAIEETRYYQGMLQSERLAAIGQTIAALSHHIKNIMQGVRFGSEMVRMGLTEDDKEMIQKGWRLVEKNQAKIDDLILDMLSYSKEREPNLEEVDIAGLIQEVLEIVRGRATDSGVKLEFTPPEKFAKVLCDPASIQHAVLNVISNALDAAQEGEQHWVRVELREDETSENAEIIVCDSGLGIPPAKLGEIFKPFVSTKGGKGTGLGLPVTRKIFREHGGDVIADNSETVGAKFTMRLPHRR